MDPHDLTRFGKYVDVTANSGNRHTKLYNEPRD
jgi:hypothetical protein